jgi:hypothetical protein
MKRSEVFLALSGAVLAFVGVASARAHYSIEKTGFYSIGLGSCTNASSLLGYTSAFPINPKVLVTHQAGLNRAIYTEKNTHSCSGKVLYTKTDESG